MTALKDLMSRDFETVRPDTLMKEAMDLMERLHLSVLLVCQDRCVMGMLLESELRTLLAEDRSDIGQTRVFEFMCREVLAGQEEQDVRDLVPPMRGRNIPMIPVLDQEARLVGVFTLGGPWKRSAQIAGRN